MPSSPNPTANPTANPSPSSVLSDARTIVHVTHEAIDHIGGIGTVLCGLLSAPSYRASVRRSILVGPLPHPDSRPADPLTRLGEYATELLYSGPDNIDRANLAPLLRPIEWAFHTRLVFGRRVLNSPGHEPAHADVLLIDVSNPNRERLAAFKWLMFEKFGVDSQRYENSWDYEEYCRLADPAYHALCALLASEQGPSPSTLVIAHEFMGLCTALRCSLDRARFRTAFHAHECSTARRLVESLPGHDLAFYPPMLLAQSQGRHIEDVFGPQSDYPRHALVSKAHHLDAIMAVGPETGQELRFLSGEMSRAPVRVVYNGLPAPTLTFAQRQRSRSLVDQWLKNVLGYAPDYLLTHVTRPVSSKGLWRDQKLGQHLQAHLAKMGKTAAYVLLTCGAPIRTLAQVNEMARRHHWPARHVEGYPDLAGPEVGIWRAMDSFNEHFARGLFSGQPPKAERGEPGSMVAVLVNQFGFTRERLGDAAPAELTTQDLRAATDVELGMSTYEPYGIAQLEPLYAGAICLPSTVCGCLGLAQRALGELGLNAEQCPVLLPADFVSTIACKSGATPDEQNAFIASCVHLGAHERDLAEDRVCAQLAAELAKRLPRSDDDRRRYLEIGQRLAAKMSWERVAQTDFLPSVREAMARTTRQVAPAPGTNGTASGAREALAAAH